MLKCSSVKHFQVLKEPVQNEIIICWLHHTSVHQAPGIEVGEEAVSSSRQARVQTVTEQRVPVGPLHPDPLSVQAG